jgi:hypothetical protein
MFMQVIEGHVDDQELLQRLGEKWVNELSPGSDGWLGVTVGVTADGTAIVVARFDSTESARRNSDRPEQGAWWAEAEKAFTGPVKFSDYEDVHVFRAGAPDDAGFVQVLLGRTDNPQRMQEVSRAFDRVPTSFRPEILGGVSGVKNDGEFAQAFYFTTEAEARVGERQEPPEGLRSLLEEEMSLPSELRYLDLTNPWHRSAT